MRVLSLLLLVSVFVLGVSGQYVLDNQSSPTQGWHFSAPAPAALAGFNPNLTLTAGNTYTFDLAVVASTNPAHPFNFSTTQLTTAVQALDVTYYTVSATGNCAPPFAGNLGWLGNTCQVSLTIKNNAPNATIFYQCTFHPSMSGNITVVANATNAGATTAAPTTAAPTTAAPTTAAPTTAAPTNGTTGAPTNGTTGAPTTGAPTTGAPTTPAPIKTITSNTFHITNNQGQASYVFTDAGVQYFNPTLQITAGDKVTFSFEWANSQYHPFGFSTKSNTDAVALTQEYFPDSLNGQTDGWSANSACNTTAWGTVARTVTIGANVNPAATPCVITIQTLKSTAGSTIYYRCGRHPAMIGTINIVGNSASTVAVSGLAVIVAIIAAIMA